MTCRKLFIDLTHTIDNDTAPYPGDPAPWIEPALVFESAGCRVQRVSLATHSGTHIDAPAHVLENGRALAGFPLESFSGAAVVLDCRDADGEIGAQVLREISRHEDEPLCWVLLFTGWAAKWGTPDYFTGGYPVPSAALLERMAALGIQGFGLDAPGPDHYGEVIRHRAWMQRTQGLIVENLVNLEQVLAAGGRCRFFAAPLKLTASDGAPVRAWAQLREG